MNRLETNKAISELFGDELIYSLKRFVKAIDAENADVIILIARKALCLFELLKFLGIDKPCGEIVSDRVLELEEKYLKDKKVLVVDDTLILGSTLRSIHANLNELGIVHKIFAFCVDNQNWKQELIMPDYIEKDYSPQQVLEFCKTIVAGLDIASVPYLVDFPITSQIELSRNSFFQMKANSSCEFICIKENRVFGRENYAVIPNNDILVRFYAFLGSSFEQIIDTLKIRLYVSEFGEKSFGVRFVPIALLKNIHKEDIESVFEHITERIAKPDDRKLLQSLMEKTEVKLRFIQYFISESLGKAFFLSLGLPEDINTSFRKTELINLFGKRLSDILETLFICPRSPGIEDRQFRSSDVVDTAPDFIDIFEDIDVQGHTVLQSIQQIFGNLWQKREKPAREAVESGDYYSHYINRLINGISFEAISYFICSKLGIEQNNDITSVLGISLDICNDLGIATPITCNHDNYYYRAYRHGELAKRTEGNHYLLSVFIKSFCERNGYDYSSGIDKLLLEKLSVLFYRMGAKSRFLDVTDDYSSPEAVNIGFYLMGAVLIENKENEYFPFSSNDWFLANHCNGLFRIGRDEKYYFHKIPDPEGGSLKQDAEYTTTVLGKTFGALIKTDQRNNVVSENEKRPLDIDKLTILASCYSVGDICVALTAELHIVSDWLRFVTKKQRVELGKMPFTETFRSSKVYQSYNQALFKFSNSFTEQKNVMVIVEDCKKFFDTDPLYYDALKDTWTNYSEKLGVGNEKIFNWDSVDEKMKKLILTISAYNFRLGFDLLYIRFLVERYYSIVNPRIVIDSEFVFKNLETDAVYKKRLVNKKREELRKTEIGRRTKAGRSFFGKTVGQKTTFNRGETRFDCQILSIDNSKVIQKSIEALDGYARNLANTLKDNLDWADLNKNLSSCHQQIKFRMLQHSTHSETVVLNAELVKTIKIMQRYKEGMDYSIDEAVRRYSLSRENIVALLK